VLIIGIFNKKNVVSGRDCLFYIKMTTLSAIIKPVQAATFGGDCKEEIFQQGQNCSMKIVSNCGLLMINVQRTIFYMKYYSI
jgi:hypothetical protein